MTPEQQAEKVLDSLAEGSHLDDLAVRDFLALKAAIAAALQPSAAVKELLKQYEWLMNRADIGDVDCGDEHCAAVRNALAAVREELGL